MGPGVVPLKHVAEFAKLRVEPDLGTIVWPNGADLAPEFLYGEVNAALAARKAATISSKVWRVGANPATRHKRDVGACHAALRDLPNPTYSPASALPTSMLMKRAEYNYENQDRGA